MPLHKMEVFAMRLLGGGWREGGLEGWIVWPGGNRGPICWLITHRDSQASALPEN